MVQVLQRGGRVDAELGVELRAGMPVVGERVGLPAAAVEGQHQLAGQTLVQRGPFGLRGQPGEQLRVVAKAQFDVGVVEFGGVPLFDQRGPHAVQPRGVQACERLATPEAECRVQ